VKTLILTNAAGGINSGFTPGDLMVIDDHINLLGSSPLTGPNDERFGVRFPDLTHVYSPRLRRLADGAAAAQGLTLRHGVYAACHGPSYETTAEVRFLRIIGADAVGMSTVPEAIVARHMGIEVLGISCITNFAAGAAAAAEPRRSAGNRAACPSHIYRAVKGRHCRNLRGCVADQSVVSVVALEVSDGQEGEFLALTGRLQALVRSKGYGTNQLLQDGSHPRRYYDIRIWRNADAAAKAEGDTDIDGLEARPREAHSGDAAGRRGVGRRGRARRRGPWQDAAASDRRTIAQRRKQSAAFNGGDKRVLPTAASVLAARASRSPTTFGAANSGTCTRISSRRRKRGAGLTRLTRISAWEPRCSARMDGCSRAATLRTLPTV
jgi:hypothetical protein